ncbi:cyclin-like protein [Recurvomyces mirabilis]|nr:cyclin-like protein [Recurvomyces mirabilis]
MPAFYGTRPSASALPITPPDSGSGYGYSNMYHNQDLYAPHHGLSQLRQDSTYDYQPQQDYMQPAIAPGPPGFSYSQVGYQSANNLPPISSYYEHYEPIGAPILPPLRINDRASFADDYQRRVQQQQQDAVTREQQRQVVKEEKATGGVSAKLDYEMERMTDFVTEATMTIFHHKMTSPPSFRKWVHQVLSATRLPSSTIMLSLHYLNDRIARFPETVTTNENQIYRLLAVGLILGSKFLDDNTFINKSWADVTAIKVTELNQLEAKWLGMIEWRLHVDPESPHGLQAWLRAWKDFQIKDIIKQQPARLSPLDTNVHRHSGHRERFSPYPTPYSAAPSRYDSATSARSSQYGSTTAYNNDLWAMSGRTSYDDYYNRSGRYPEMSEMDSYNRRAADERARQSAYAYQQNAHASYYPTPAYGSTWDQPAWNAAHRYDCACTACAYQSHYRPYSMATGYSAQAVMG